jgi:cytochrome c-type biogenesis protein CcmE
MVETHWEKDRILAKRKIVARSGRWKYLVIGVIILAAMAYLLVTSVGARYYVTVDELLDDGDMHGKTVRVSGAVVGEPVFDPATNSLHFVVANIPNSNDEIKEQGGLALVLHNAVNDPEATRLRVVAHDTEIPDLLQHEAQAIMSGELKFADGEPVFYADEITLKCPTKYEDEVPEQVQQ